jgi:hypothetical protein
VEIDTSRLGLNFKANDKLTMQVMQLNPIAIQVLPEQKQLREQVLSQQIKQLLPLQPERQNSLNTVFKAQHLPQLPTPVGRSVQQLLEHVTEKTFLQQPQQLQRAIENSGSFLESKLLQRPEQSVQDFKANLERLISSLKQAISASETSTTQQARRVAIQSLPVTVQNALLAITESPENLSKVPAQVKLALAKLGVTPEQLLMSVLKTQSNVAEKTLPQEGIAPRSTIVSNSAPVDKQAVSQRAAVDIANRTAVIENSLVKQLNEVRTSLIQNPVTNIKVELLPFALQNALKTIIIQPTNLSQVPMQIKSALSKLAIRPEQLLLSQAQSPNKQGEVLGKGMSESETTRNSFNQLTKQVIDQSTASVNNKIAIIENTLLKEINAARESAVLRTPITNISQQQLPVELQTALRDLSGQVSNDMTKLEPQLKSLLARLGITTTQLLSNLLSVQTKNTENFLTTQPSAQGAQTVIPQAQVTRQSEAGQQQAILQNRVAAVEVALLKELLKEAEATHARVQLNQVSMLKDPESVSTPNLWLFDVPVKDKERIELLQVRVEQHKHNAEELEGDIWEVQLRLDTEQLGPLQAMISLHEQDVKVQLTAQWPDTASLLEVSIDELTNNLSGLGVTVSHMDCQCGEVAPVSHQLVSNDIPKGLLDISV